LGRPTGVTILGILYLLEGIIAIILALVIGVIASSFAGSSVLGGVAAIGGFASGLVFLVAIFEFIIAGALFSGKSWGRIIVIIFAIIDLMVNAITLLSANVFAIAFILLDLIVLYYMWRPHVMEYFKADYSKN